MEKCTPHFRVKVGLHEQRWEKGHRVLSWSEWMQSCRERLTHSAVVFTFQGQWKNKFDKGNVFASDFHVSASRSCSVSMMYQEARFRYRDFPDDHVQLLEMPYLGDDITMVIILPSKDTALSQVIQIIDYWCQGANRIYNKVHLCPATVGKCPNARDWSCSLASDVISLCTPGDKKAVETD